MNNSVMLKGIHLLRGKAQKQYNPEKGKGELIGLSKFVTRCLGSRIRMFHKTTLCALTIQARMLVKIRVTISVYGYTEIIFGSK